MHLPFHPLLPARWTHLRRGPSGFTQVELLITTLIIALLVALAIPVVNASRRSAQAAICVSNLRQVGSAVLRFSNDYQGKILPRQLSDALAEKEPKAQTYWIRRLIQEKYITSPINNAPIHPTLFCPSLLPGGHPHLWSQSYGMRSWRGTRARTVDEYLPLAIIPEPSRFFLLTDSISGPSGHQWYAIQFPNTSNGIHLRHSGRANAFFADGHVAPMEANYFLSLPTREPEFTYKPFNVFDASGAAL